jgi:uncharacterized protein YlxP (DUF503 family)
VRDHTTAQLHVGFAVVDLHIPSAQSLKDRRSVVSRAVATLKNELGASVAEVGGQTLWQRAILGVSVCAPTPTAVERSLDGIVSLIERDVRMTVLRIVSVYDTLSYP